MTTTAAPAVNLLERVRQHRASIYAAKTVAGRTGGRRDIWPTAIIESAGDSLRDLVIREGARRTLEVGTGLGLSSLAIVEGLLTVGGDVRHVTMDYGQGRWDHAGEQALIDSGADAVTTFMPKQSCVGLAQLLDAGERFDLAFVDAGHQFDEAMVDLFFALRLVKPNGLIVLDDHWMPSIQTVLSFCTTNWGLELELFDPNGPAARLVAMRNNGAAMKRPWDHFVPFCRADLPAYAWR